MIEQAAAGAGTLNLARADYGHFNRAGLVGLIAGHANAACRAHEEELQNLMVLAAEFDVDLAHHRARVSPRRPSCRGS